MESRILCETEHFSLSHDHETPVLKNKQTGEHIRLRPHYGDPVCGLIDGRERWCIVGGLGISVFILSSHREMNFLDDGTYYIHSMKQNGEDRVLFLVDPWSDNHGTWLLDLAALSVTKVGDDPDMRGRPYREHVDY